LSRKHVLVVEDESNIRDTLRFNLSREGYRVSEASTGGEAIREVESASPDVVLLDVMLPEMSGFEVCRRIRRTSSVPIIMLTAKDQESEKVLGLGLGADDYLTKPFSLHELYARIQAVLRRSSATAEAAVPAPAGVTAAGGLRLDREARRVTVNGEELHLSKKEFDLLAFLLAKPGKVFSRDQLIQNVWEYSFVGDRKTVDVHVRWLRQKLGEPSPFSITTVRGVGYRLDLSRTPAESID
jgi:DNA-binding response OmpR family regulator